jgi:hypothetical protein
VTQPLSSFLLRHGCRRLRLLRHHRSCRLCCRCCRHTTRAANCLAAAAPVLSPSSPPLVSSSPPPSPPLVSSPSLPVFSPSLPPLVSSPSPPPVPSPSSSPLHPRAAKPKPLASLYRLTRTHAQVAHKLHYANGTRPIQSARQNFDPRVRWHNTISTARAVARFANHKRANHENDKLAMSSDLEDNGGGGGSTSWHALR